VPFRLIQRDVGTRLHRNDLAEVDHVGGVNPSSFELVDARYSVEETDGDSVIDAELRLKASSRLLDSHHSQDDRVHPHVDAAYGAVLIARQSAANVARRRYCRVAHDTAGVWLDQVVRTAPAAAKTVRRRVDVHEVGDRLG
jgi:hypothetical protein